MNSFITNCDTLNRTSRSRSLPIVDLYIMNLNHLKIEVFDLHYQLVRLLSHYLMLDIITDLYRLLQVSVARSCTTIQHILCSYKLPVTLPVKLPTSNPPVDDVIPIITDSSVSSRPLIFYYYLKV